MRYLKVAGKNRIVAGAFGADDFLTDFGIERSYKLEELDYFRKYFALHCAAHKVVSIDTPYVYYKDLEGLKIGLKYLKGIGMKAKFAIHPLQIDIINEAFRPSEIEVKFAQGLVVAFEKAMKEGKAAISYENKMCDIPVYKRMVNLLKRAGLR
jgi:citrate lyase beta subunit